jgi:hypothetical protein
MLACAGLLCLPASASAQDPAAEVPDIAKAGPQAPSAGPSLGIARSSVQPGVWATVNICDTESNPDSMGVRASMAGNGTGQRMRMRFRAEYWSRARQEWTPVTGAGISPWVPVGSAAAARRQGGWTFVFAEPPAGVTFTMRAQVQFEWRRRRPRAARAGGSRIARSEVRTTATGIRGVHGGDPPGTSKAMCLVY